MGQFAPQKRHRHQAVLKRHAEIEEYQVAASLHRFVDRGHAIVYCVPHLVGRCGFDELPNSTAHRGTIVNDEQSGPGLAGHRREKLLRCLRQNQ